MSEIQIGQVYEIFNDENTDTYVGSTFNSLGQRYSQHKHNSKNLIRSSYNSPIYTAMRELGIEKFHITCLETVECKDKTELLQHEQRYMDELKPVYNYQRAFNTDETRKIVSKAYYEKNKIELYQKSKEQVKQWHDENKTHVKTYKAEHYEKNKTAIRVKQKQYAKDNAEIAKARAKAWALANTQISICECGASVKKKQKSKHIKTKMHLNFINKVVVVVPDTHTKCGCGTIYRTVDKKQHIKSKKHIKFAESDI